MRCRACDCRLSFFESTRKSEITKEFLDLCNRCFVDTDISTGDERYDLEGTGEHFIEDVTNSDNGTEREV